ncbi:helix-turn-helix domain-containing protein [Flaviaesturariibacter aridisoli]|uniref:AraC family transcriptional regulator n=1 Tax=Flaviaesturariibacter aridisoli TaxID=2545761 RepID=A0A4V2WLX3_9BACT|nr:AraC family transcriptional regulator [Flaviaesturariibacter aridisoli]TCZ65180.1 AraC family transcriptional regulator [Flaviaesturariibacter aridisoli]
MVSARCRFFVKAQLEALGLHHDGVEIGHAEIRDPVTPAQLEALNNCLKEAGLELTKDNGNLLVDRIKKAVFDSIQLSAEPPVLKFSEFLSSKLHYDYSYLSHLFATREGTTLEHFTIAAKIDMVKELMLLEGLTLTDIADRMFYSSVQHLSAQFKKVTGLTPTAFRKKMEAMQKAPNCRSRAINSITISQNRVTK